MKIDMDNLTESELVELNRLIVERLRFMEQMRVHRTMMTFSVGERVQFHSNAGILIKGVITRYNRKTVTIITDDNRQWTVSPSLLERDAIEVTVESPSNFPTTRNR